MKLLDRTMKCVRIATIAAAATLASQPALAQERITVAGGSTGGVFFSLATGMAEMMSKSLDGYSVTAGATGGSGENVRLLGTNGAQFGLLMADAAYNGHEGKDAFADEGGYDNVVGVMMTYDQVMHLVVPADSPIKTMADLKGRRVSPGPAGSGTALMVAPILEAYGLTGQVRLDPLSHSQQMTALGDGQLDAAFLLLPAGSSTVASFAAASPIRFIPMDDTTTLASVESNYPFYFPMDIEAGAYEGQPEAVPSLGVSVALATNSDVDEELVYQVTKLFNEHPQDLAAYHAIARSISTEKALTGMPIPLHPGAQRYYEEVAHSGLSQ